MRFPGDLRSAGTGGARWFQAGFAVSGVTTATCWALAAGKSIVTGGALGTDYWATEVALGIDPARVKVILPTSLVTYAAHYRQRAAEGVISAQQAENLIRQLEAVARAGGLVEHPERPQVVNVTTYYLRNQDVVDAADELLAFQVNASAGTQDTVDRARLKGIPVAVFTFEAANGPRPSGDNSTSLGVAAADTLMSTDRRVDDLFRQHRRILQPSDRWLELPEKVQQQSAATAPAEISLRPTLYEPLTCASDLHRPLCLQMVRRSSQYEFVSGTYTCSVVR